MREVQLEYHEYIYEFINKYHGSIFVTTETEFVSDVHREMVKTVVELSDRVVGVYIEPIDGTDGPLIGVFIQEGSTCAELIINAYGRYYGISEEDVRNLAMHARVLECDHDPRRVAAGYLLIANKVYDLDISIEEMEHELEDVLDLDDGNMADMCNYLINETDLIE